MTNLTISILYEDSDLLVIEKPAGMVVNRAQTVNEPTVQDWAEKYLKVAKVSQVPKVSRKEGIVIPSIDTSGTFDAFDTFRSRSGIVHRLDKETSGCLMIAKNPTVFTTLQLAFRERRVKKTYVALVHGMLTGEGEVKAPVGRLPWNRERFGILPGGKEAVTKYKVITHYQKSIKNKNIEYFTLVELYPESGRTHQLRVHLKYIGHPIVGDYLYAGRKTQRNDRKWCPRVFLHATRIEFPHPTLGTTNSVNSLLPEDLHRVLASLIERS